MAPIKEALLPSEKTRPGVAIHGFETERVQDEIKAYLACAHSVHPA